MSGGHAGGETSLAALGRRIDAERNNRSMTQEQLATSAGCSPKVIRKVIRGEKTHGRILAEICKVLDIRPGDDQPVEVADLDHGSYTLANFAPYVGRYFAYRRSLLFPRNILRSAYSIVWDKKARLLHFQEHQKYRSAQTGEFVDRSQSGDIYFGNRSGLLHLLTCERGSLRLITLSQFRLRSPDDLTMLGLVLTQAPRQFQHQPSAAAIMFEKTSVPEPEFRKFVGEIRPGDPAYAKLNAELIETERHVVNFALTPPPQNLSKPELG